jgi:hypothetical protein
VDGGLSADLTLVHPPGPEDARRFPTSGQLSRQLAASPTRYGMPRANIFSAGPDWDHALGHSPVFHINQVYAAGHNLMLTGTSMQGSIAYLKRLVDVRRSMQNALVEGAQSDLLVTDSVVARRYLGTSVEALTVLNRTAALLNDLAISLPGVPNGTVYCDYVERTPHQVGSGQLVFDVPPALDDQDCVHSPGNYPVCGMRVLIRGACPP